MKRTIFIILALLLSSPLYAAVTNGDLLAGVEPGPDGMIDVLTIFAHQDDESVYGGGTLLLLARDPRVRLHILCMTLGDMSEAKDKLSITPEHLARIRIEELETAAAVYGAESVVQFDYHDQGLMSADFGELVENVEKVIDDTSAEVVITHDPSGITGHDDHKTTSKVALAAFKKSGAQKLYYVTMKPSLYRTTKVIAPFAVGDKPVKPDFKVDISEVKKLKKMAMYAHASQKHFSGVGIAMKAMLMFDHEYFALGDEN